jgi:hypothetical protein
MWLVRVESVSFQPGRSERKWFLPRPENSILTEVLDTAACQRKLAFILLRAFGLRKRLALGRHQGEQSYALALCEKNDRG